MSERPKKALFDIFFRCLALSWSVILVLMIGLTLSSCSSLHSMRGSGRKTVSADYALRRILQRWDQWRSMSAHTKVTVNLKESSFSAKGYLQYLIGERYKIGFRRPYNQVIGELYIEPNRIVYWNPGGQMEAYTDSDSITFSNLSGAGLPNWDPRDFLPFPISGRSSGLKVDSVWTKNEDLMVDAHGVRVDYLLRFDRYSGDIKSETIRRSGRNQMNKIYKSVKSIHGWPVAVKIVCADSTNKTYLSWSLKSVDLEAPFCQIEDAVPDSSKMETTP